MAVSRRFAEALVYAADVHAGQVRKGTRIPYIAHLIEVAAIVLQHGGGETEAIGALLHDAAEDGGGRARLDDIRLQFGDAVAHIVDGCTDTYESPKPEWRPRKEAYVARIPREAAEVRLVSCADKLANARAILEDHRDVGAGVWDRFKGGREGTLWYYEAVSRAFSTAGPSPLTARLARVVRELQAEAGEDGGGEPRR